MTDKHRKLKMNDKLRAYLERARENEVALRNRIRYLYEKKDEMKGYGFEEDLDIDYGGAKAKAKKKKVTILKKNTAAKKAATKNPWLKFLAKYRKEHEGLKDNATIMHDASIEYKKLKKSKKITGKGYEFVEEYEGCGDNEWTRFIHRVAKRSKKEHSMAQLKQLYKKYKEGLAKRRKTLVKRKAPAKKRVVKKKAPAKRRVVKKKAIGGVLLDY